MGSGVVKEKEQAKAEYEQAVGEHKQAALLSQEQADVFICTIGNIQPNQR